MENVENMEPAKGKEQKSTQKTITSFFKPPAKTPLVDNFKESGPRSHKTPLKSVNESCDDTESQKTTRRRRKPNYVISEDEEEEEQPSNKKSKIGKPRPLSDDSDDDYVPSDRDVSDSEGHEEDDSYHMDIDVPESSNSKRKRPNTDGFRTPAKKRLDQFRTLHLSSSPVSATNASPIARKEVFI
ncbi:hypothetical protein BC829DRAFT_383111 [Chytridium lagenaria]|nr:hypothetical protein BC829DRAFT_383111 [Chytridium lagenaria]